MPKVMSVKTPEKTTQKTGNDGRLIENPQIPVGYGLVSNNSQFLAQSYDSGEIIIFEPSEIEVLGYVRTSEKAKNPLGMILAYEECIIRVYCSDVSWIKKDFALVLLSYDARGRNTKVHEYRAVLKLDALDEEEEEVVPKARQTTKKAVQVEDDDIPVRKVKKAMALPQEEPEEENDDDEYEQEPVPVRKASKKPAQPIEEDDDDESEEQPRKDYHQNTPKVSARPSERLPAINRDDKNVLKVAKDKAVQRAQKLEELSTKRTPRK